MMVTSLDGRITEGDKPGTAWASPEDQSIFHAHIAAYDCIVMGRKTYEAARSSIKPDPRKQRVVMTRRPDLFAHEQRPGLLFSADSPQAIVAQAKARGSTSLLLVGGAQVNVSFIDAGLVDELLITIEPLLFGNGTPLVDTLRRTVPLKLIHYEQLNDQGTLLARYLVQKPGQ
jgi:dihydrofolate reductase